MIMKKEIAEAGTVGGVALALYWHYYWPVYILLLHKMRRQIRQQHQQIRRRHQQQKRSKRKRRLSQR